MEYAQAHILIRQVNNITDRQNEHTLATSMRTALLALIRTGFLNKQQQGNRSVTSMNI